MKGTLIIPCKCLTSKGQYCIKLLSHIIYTIKLNQNIINILHIFTYFYIEYNFCMLRTGVTPKRKAQEK